MRSLFQSTLLQLALFASLGLVVGYELSSIWAGLALAAVIYIAIMLLNFRRVSDWLLLDARVEIPVANTFWTTIMDQISRIIRKLEVENSALKADVDFFKDSFEALDSAVVVIDERGEIDWANVAAQALLGVAIARDKGELLVNLIRAPEFINYLDSGDFSKPLKLHSPVDPQLSLEIQATPFRHEYVLIFVRDVSELAHLESIRQDFIANVSHELRTPLTVITGYLDIIKGRDDQMPPAMLRVVYQMLAQSQRMDSMVNDLIWLSRLETLPEGQKTELIPLAGLVFGLIEEARISAPDKAVSFKLDQSTEGASSGSVVVSSEGLALAAVDNRVAIRGNYDELRAAFSNLLQNAIKYTAVDGCIEIIGSWHRDGFQLKFKDNGIGIDPVHLPRLTERFYRVDDSRTSSTGGTGLGLAIVKHVLIRHQAELHVSSTEGHGSSFTCVFPAHLVTK